MSHLKFLSMSVLTTLLSSGSCSSQNLRISNKQLVENEGFGYEFYQIKTEDGFLIGLHRIVNKSRERGKPVLFVNGFGIRSRSWILRGKNKDFPFILAELGYDVWLGDQRGNPYSDQHDKYSYDEKQFWDFSFHETGVYDLPAMIDHILNTTGYKKISYVGQSLGSMFYFIMLSEKEEYDRKIAASIHLVPATIPPHIGELTYPLRFAINVEIYILKWLRNYAKILDSQVKYFIDLMMELLLVGCSGPPLQELCLYVSSVLFGGSMKNFDREHIGYQMAASVGYASMKTSEHLTQIYQSGKLRKYDYGMEKNLEIYGQSVPLEYNISKATLPTALFIADRDDLVPYDTSMKIVGALGKEATTYVLHGFNHIEAGMGLNSKQCYAKAVKFLNRVHKNEIYLNKINSHKNSVM